MSTFRHCGRDWYLHCGACGFSQAETARAQTAEERRVRRLVENIHHRLESGCDDHSVCGAHCSCGTCLAAAYDEAAEEQRTMFLRPGR